MMMLTNYTGGGGKQQQQQQIVKSDSPPLFNQNVIINSKSLQKALQIRTKAENLLKRQLITQQPSNSKHHPIVIIRQDETNEVRQEILKMLSDYYARIPLANVQWNTSDVEQCLHDSMANFDNFDPYKAKQAFKLISSMLMNLINWPWLKEYYRIVTYGGMFKSLILQQLSQTKCINIFRRIGYRLEPNHILELTHFNATQKNTDIITSTIFDCLMAEAICQDLIDVYENSRLYKSVTQSNSLGSMQTAQVNYKSWIKFYYKQRLDLLSDCSALNIHNRLNSIVLVASLTNNGLSKAICSSDLYPNSGVQDNGGTSRGIKTHPCPTRLSSKESASANRRFVANNNSSMNRVNSQTENASSSSDERRREEFPFSGDNLPKYKQPKSNSKFYVANYLEQQKKLDDNLDRSDHMQRLTPRQDSNHSPIVAFSKTSNNYNTAPLVKIHLRNSQRNAELDGGLSIMGRYHAKSTHPHDVFDVPHNDKEPLINNNRRLSSITIDSMDNFQNRNEVAPHYRGSDSKRSSIYDNVDGIGSPVGQSKQSQYTTNHCKNIKNHNIKITRGHQGNSNYDSSSQSTDSYEHMPSSDPGTYTTRLHVISEDKKKRPVNYQADSSSRQHCLTDSIPRLWSCATCTYNNSSKATICEMCQTTREKFDTPMIECPHSKSM